MLWREKHDERQYLLGWVTLCKIPSITSVSPTRRMSPLTRTLLMVILSARSLWSLVASMGYNYYTSYPMLVASNAITTWDGEGGVVSIIGKLH